MPAGWAVVVKGSPEPKSRRGRSLAFSGAIGKCCFETKTITAPPTETRYALYVMLHECGHAHLHGTDPEPPEVPNWQFEYEAEQYAITAMRAAGVAVPRAVHAEARDYVASLLEKEGDADAPDEVWRFAYPDAVDSRRRKR